MNFLSFEYVLAIARAGTLRGAAETLYVSPQALSEHLGKLERELGVALFLRTKPLTPTPDGERFLACAETCLTAKQELETELAALSRQNDDRVSLGVPSGMPPPLLLSFLTYFRHARPDLTVTVTELSTRTGALRELPGHIDAVLGEFREEDGRIRYRSILESRRFVVALRRELMRRSLPPVEAEQTERKVRAGEPVALSVFRDCPFVLKRTGSIVRQNEDRMFGAVGFSPRGTMETGDMELTVRMVLLGEAAVFLPEPVARANLLLPAPPETDASLLLCPVDVGQERWVLSLGLDRYRRVPRAVDALAEIAAAYYEKALGS